MTAMDGVSPPEGPDETARSWQPLASAQRRVLGVLVEKAKTTPESYPLSLNAVRVGANQKSNRSPQMQLEDDRVEEALDALRQFGAATMIQGDSRVAKYRHQAYEWLGVDKVEMAVMAELLLRGEQTLGELRGRSARMEPIADLSALRPVLASLEEKELIEYLTPQGRGCMLTHALYHPSEMERLRAQYASGAAAGREPRSASSPQGEPPASDSELRAEVDGLRREVEQLRAEVAELRSALGGL